MHKILPWYPQVEHSIAVIMKVDYFVSVNRCEFVEFNSTFPMNIHL